MLCLWLKVFRLYRLILVQRELGWLAYSQTHRHPDKHMPSCLLFPPHRIAENPSHAHVLSACRHQLLNLFGQVPVSAIFLFLCFCPLSLLQEMFSVQVSSEGRFLQLVSSVCVCQNRLLSLIAVIPRSSISRGAPMHNTLPCSHAPMLPCRPS